MSLQPEDINSVTSEELNQLSEDSKKIATRHLLALSRLQTASQMLAQTSAPVQEHQKIKEVILFLDNMANSSLQIVRQLIYPIRLKGEKNGTKKINKKSKTSRKRSSKTRSSRSSSTKKAKA